MGWSDILEKSQTAGKQAQDNEKLLVSTGIQAEGSHFAGSKVQGPTELFLRSKQQRHWLVYARSRMKGVACMKRVGVEQVYVLKGTEINA